MLAACVCEFVSVYVVDSSIWKGSIMNLSVGGLRVSCVGPRPQGLIVEQAQ